MKFARIVFLVAGIYGLIVLLPLYFLEAQTGRDYPPPITHPEYYYGFVGVGVAWLLAFLVILGVLFIIAWIATSNREGVLLPNAAAKD